MRIIDADDAIERLGAYLMADAQIEWCGTASEDIEDWKELASDILKGAPTIKTKQVKYYDEDEKVWKIGEVIVNSSEKPNNCEHITEDGVTCARYPACDDCPDNPLNKVKGSERLVKGSERSSE